jgi:hypothetical protein
MGGYTMAVSGQWLGKHVTIARQQFLIIEQLDYNNGIAVFSMWSVPRCYKKRTRSGYTVLYGRL